MVKKDIVTTRIALSPGTVFRYTTGKRKVVLFVPPRSHLMPKLVAGEEPKASTNPDDYGLVKILWSPEEAIKRLPQNTDDD